MDSSRITKRMYGLLSHLKMFAIAVHVSILTAIEKKVYDLNDPKARERRGIWQLQLEMSLSMPDFPWERKSNLKMPMKSNF